MTETTISKKLLKSIEEFQAFTKVNDAKFVGIINGDGIYAILLREDKTTGELYLPKLIKTDHGFKTMPEGGLP
jgi:hypothetical protein